MSPDPVDGIQINSLTEHMLILFLMNADACTEYGEFYLTTTIGNNRGVAYRPILI